MYIKYVFLNIYTYIYNIYIYYIYTGLYSREYNPVYIYIYIYIYISSNPWSNNKSCSTAGSRTMYELLRTVTFYSQNFLFFLKTSSKLCFYLETFTGNFYLSHPIQKYLYMLQYYPLEYFPANRDTKDSIAMQIRLIARSALTGS